METKLKRAFLLIYFFMIGTSSQLFPIQPSSQGFFVTEFVRVKRQAGYVYNKPSIPFNLPMRPSNTTTQTTNVDRTQEQHMYYAYPVPSGGNGAKPGYSSVPSESAIGSNAGYNYGTQSNEGVTQTKSTSGSTFSGGRASFSQTGSGYNYNSPGGSVGSGQTSTTTSSSTATSSVSVGYGYGAPSSSNTGQVDFSSSSQGTKKGPTLVNSDQDSGTPGYNAPSVSSGQISPQTNPGFSLVETNSIKTGYGYDAPTSSSSAGQTNANFMDNSKAGLQTVTRSNSVESNPNSISPGYGYDAPSDRGQATKTNNSSTATSSVSTNYNYDPPASTNQGLIDTSTNAPQYLPPISGGNSEVDVGASDGYGGGNTGSNDGSGESTSGIINGRATYGGGINNGNGGEAGYAKTGGIGGSSNFGISVDVSGGFKGVSATGYGSTGGPAGYTSVDDSNSSVSGYNIDGNDLNSGIKSNFAITRPSNTYIPPSSASASPSPSPSFTYIPPAKDFSSSSVSFSNGATIAPMSKPSINYISPSSVSNIPSSLSSFSVLPSPLSTYIATSNSHTGPSRPSQSDISINRLSSTSKPVQAYISPKSVTIGTTVEQPSPTYLPQTIRSTGSDVRIPPQTYIPQSTKSTGPAGLPSQIYIPKSSDSTRSAPVTPSLNYISQSSVPSSLTRSSERTAAVTNANYLPPNGSSDPPVPVSNSGPLRPTANYLPTLSNLIPRQQSPPATYLPPVF